MELAADGVSYMATGKSTTDHAISAVAGQDCALLRPLKEQAICNPDGEVLISFVGAETSDEESWGAGDFPPHDD